MHKTFVFKECRAPCTLKNNVEKLIRMYRLWLVCKEIFQTLLSFSKFTTIDPHHRHFWLNEWNVKVTYIYFVEIAM